MTIWVATIPIIQSEDAHDSPVGFTPYTPPYGFKLLKRNRGITLNVDGVETILNLYKLKFPKPEDDLFWIGRWLDDQGMNDERQTLINRTLCEAVVRSEDVNSNAMAVWYLPRAQTPDEMPLRILRRLTLSEVNFIRAKWLSREGVTHAN